MGTRSKGMWLRTDQSDIDLFVLEEYFVSVVQTFQELVSKVAAHAKRKAGI